MSPRRSLYLPRPPGLRLVPQEHVLHQRLPVLETASLPPTALSALSPLPGRLSLPGPSRFLLVPFSAVPVESGPDALTEDTVSVAALTELCPFLLQIYPDS